MIKLPKLIFLSLLCSVFFVSVQAQNKNKIDSLLNVLKLQKDDTVKVENILSVCKLYFNYDPEAFLKYALQSFGLSEKIKYDKGKVESLHAISGYYYYTSNYDTALLYCNMALIIIEKTGDKKGLMDSYSNIATIYSVTGNNAKEYENELKALKISEELNDTQSMAAINNNLGETFKTRGDYDKAVDYCIKGLKLSEKINDSIGIANRYASLGGIYLSAHEYDKALSTQFQLLNICEKINDLHDASRAYYVIASVYNDQGKQTESLNYYEKTLEASKKINDLQSIASAYTGMGCVYFDLHEPDKALIFQLKTKKILEEIGDKGGLSENYLNIGKIYNEEKDYPKAIECFTKGLAIANEIGAIEIVTNIYKFLSETYSKMKNYKMAFDTHVLFTQMNDSIHNVESAKKIAEIQAKYDVDKKENEITLLTKEKEVQNVEIKKQKLLKNSMIGGFALVLILSFFVYNNFRIANKLKLQNIRNRIASDLHDDVGSTLNSISVYSEVAKQKSPTVVHELEQIGDASRKIIEVMSDIVWTINPKNDTFENIISRMSTLAYNVLKAKNIEHTFRADESLNETKLSLESRRNFYLIFKEALNNLVKYSNATRASITLTGESGLIKLSVRDNGVGFDIAQTSKGNGLLNMKARADEMNAQLKIESEKGSGTNVELILKG